MFGAGGSFADSTAKYIFSSNKLIFFICIFASTTLFGKFAMFLKKKKRLVYAYTVPAAVVCVMLLCTSYLVDSSYNPFLYFRF